MCTLVFRKEKRKKKNKQLITNSNPTMIYLHASHHVEESTIAHLVIRCMTKFDHQKASHVPPTYWGVWNMR
jgi:hypothetical protein